MPQELVTLSSDNSVRINSNVCFDNVMQVYDEGAAILKNYAHDLVNIDLSMVQVADSSCLALLIEWMRITKLNNKSVVLKNPSRALVDLGRVCGLDEVLPFG